MVFHTRNVRSDKESSSTYRSKAGARPFVLSFETLKNSAVQHQMDEYLVHHECIPGTLSRRDARLLCLKLVLVETRVQAGVSHLVSSQIRNTW